MTSSPWHQNADFYEVNERAFKDRNRDSHGDPNGLTQKHDYLKDLGIDCLWLLLIYSSSLKKDSHDILDYTNLLC